MFLVLEAAHSHLSPGLTGRIPALPEGLDAALREGAVNCAVEFADGASAFARLSARAGGTYLLSVGSYETRRGTRILAKRWALTIEQVDGAAAFRVTERLPTDDAG